MAVTRAFTTSQLDSRVDFYYTATSGQTTFSGSDDNGSTLSYTASGKKDVYLNGTLLIESDDYVATNGTSVVLQATTQAGDIVHISVNKVMSNLVNLVDTAVDLNGNELILDADGDTSITADTDDQIDFKTGGTDRMHIDSSGRVGIGTTSPDGKFHVETASSGATANTGADELVLEGTGNVGMSFLTSTTGANRIYFGDSDNALSGVIKYDHNIDAMFFDTNGSERIRIDSSGDVGIGTTSPRNELTVDGIISGITVNTSSGNTNTTIKSGMSGAYLAFVTWNNGSGYATLHVSTALSSSGQIIASSNSSGGNNAFDVTNNFSSNSGNGIALFINGTNLNLQTKDNWSANAHPIRISLFGG